MRKSKEKFIEDSKIIHGDRYDYSGVEYVNSFTKVKIICNKHGVFCQTPHNHLNGNGCSVCGKEKRDNKNRYTTEEFVDKAKKIHGNRYCYNKSNYISTNTKLIITCKIHGDFWQTPHNHLQGNGCDKCKKRKKRKTTEFFVEEAKNVHGNKYDYSKVKYVVSTQPVIVTCPIHGDFFQSPKSHLNGHGCPVCGNSVKKTTEEFIEHASKIHGDKYDYSKTKYITCKEKLRIICSEHGEFWQLPNNHLKGQGCPRCRNNRLSQLFSKTNEDFIKEAHQIHGDRYDYSKVNYNNSKKKVIIICSNHGEFLQTPDDHLNGCGCPRCSESKLEREVANFLIEKNIKFERQKTFPWLGKQRLDFYLSDYNIAIECQGEQHFKPVDFAGKGVEWASKQFNECIERDRLKKERCESNDVRLIYYNNIETPIDLTVNKDEYHSCDDLLSLL